MVRPRPFAGLKPRSPRDPHRVLSLKDVLLGGGLLITVFGTGGEVVKEWVKDDRLEICSAAHEAMRDDALNREVPETLRKEYLKNQARVAISCAKAGLE